MAKMMKALVKKEAGTGIWMGEVEVPTIGANDVLIKVRKTAICGTDMHIYNWDDWAQRTIKTPMTIGHEFVGEIVEVGQNVTLVKVGQIVSGEGHIVCGHCTNCKSGREHLCPNTVGVGVNRNGAFAQYLAIPARNVWPVDPAIDERLYSFFDPFGNATHTALSFDLVAKTVLVTGAGPIGIMAAAIAQKAGAAKVMLTDVNDYRLELAKKMGVKHAVNTKEKSIKEWAKEIGVNGGFQVGMEISGNTFAFHDMINNMAMGGSVAMLGIQPAGAEVNWDKIIFNGLTLKGIYGREMFNTWYQMTGLIQAGLDISPLITHEFDVTDFQKGFDAMGSGNSGKVILDWTKLS